MKYHGYMPNDFINGKNVSVSLWTSGCPHRCEGCWNPETWDNESGVEIPNDLKGQLIKAISANGIERNFSVLGGEPLSPYNKEFTDRMISAVRAAYPNIKIFVWTGYLLEELPRDKYINSILENIDYLIDGPFIQEQKDLTLELRGSSNQRILQKKIDF